MTDSHRSHSRVCEDDSLHLLGLPGTIMTTQNRPHSANIFDLAAFARPKLRLEHSGPPPLPRISGLCSARRDVDIDYSLSAAVDNDIDEVVVVEEAEDTGLTSTPLLAVRPRQYSVPTPQQPPILTAWSYTDEDDMSGIKIEPEEVHDAGAIKPSDGKDIETPPPPQLTQATSPAVLNESARSGSHRGQRMKTGQPPQRQRFVCNICHRSLASRRGLARHRITVHDIATHNCSVCHRQFRNRSALVNHNKMHQRYGETVEPAPPSTPPVQRQSPVANKAPPVKSLPKARTGVRAAKTPVKLGGFLAVAASKVVRKRRRPKPMGGRTRKPKRPAPNPSPPPLVNGEETAEPPPPVNGEETAEPPPPKRRRRQRKGVRVDGYIQRCGVHACRVTLWSRENYLEHIRLLHPEREVLLCDYCDRVFLSMKQYRFHQRKHQFEVEAEAMTELNALQQQQQQGQEGGESQDEEQQLRADMERVAESQTLGENAASET